MHSALSYTNNIWIQTYLEQYDEKYSNHEN